MMTKRLVAVDLGASGGKCFVATFEGRSFSMQEIHRFAYGGSSFWIRDSKGSLDERAVWDDVFIYQNIIAGLQAYKREFDAPLDSIGIDTWGADGQTVSKDGDLLGKIYCYRDHRLDTMIDEVKSRMDPRRIYEITGIHFQPFNLSNQLCWFAMNRGHLWQDGATFLPIPSVMYYYLGGGTQVDSSWASVTQLMDAKAHEWSAEICEKLGIPMSIMPEIVEPGTVVGELHEPLAASVGLNQAALTAVGSHDTASAFAAAPVADPDDTLIISSGTWSLLGKLIPEPITSVAAMEAGISNEGGIGNTRFLKNCMGTWLVQELIRGWSVSDGKKPDWKELDEMTEAAPAFTSFVDPDDESFYNPSDMEAAIAAFCRKTDQPVPADRGTYLRMVYESLALKYRQVNEQICSVSGGSTKVVNIVGGGSKNLLLNQFTADALGIPVEAGPEEGTAVGNLMVQAMGQGIIKDMSEALPIIKEAFPIKTYAPTSEGNWDNAYEHFQKLKA